MCSSLFVDYLLVNFSTQSFFAFPSQSSCSYSQTSTIWHKTVVTQSAYIWLRSHNTMLCLLVLCSSSYAGNKCPFFSLLSAFFFFLLKMVSEQSATMLSSVPKVVMLLMEKMHLLDKLPSGTRHQCICWEFNVNESTAYIK